MALDCRNCPLRRKPLFEPFSAEELAFMRSFKRGELSVDAGSTILMQGSNAPQVFTVLEGQGLRYKTLEDGARQVLNLALPGDFLGLQAGVMGEMQHSVEATTAMTLCVFSRSELWRMFRSHPSRAFDLTWLAALEEHFLGETLATIGRRDAMGRIAWGILKYARRMEALGLMRAGTVPLPYTQQDLADLFGLSLVHTNKTLKKLRLTQIATWRPGRLTLHDAGRLAALAGEDAEGAARRRPLM